MPPKARANARTCLQPVSRATVADIAKRSPNTIAAVLYCLTNNVGARRVMGLMSEDKKSMMFPFVVKSEIDKHLQKLKKLPIPDGDWNITNVGQAMFPKRNRANLHLLTEKEELSLVKLIEAKNTAGDSVPRSIIRRQVRVLLQERRKQLGDPRYTIVAPLCPTAKTVLDSPANDPTTPSNKWFIKFYKTHSDRIHEVAKTQKDVQRGRSTDAKYLWQDMDQLRENLVHVGITDVDGKFKVIPEDKNKNDGMGGWHARSRLIQVDEKGTVFLL